MGQLDLEQGRKSSVIFSCADEHEPAGLGNPDSGSRVGLGPRERSDRGGLSVFISKLNEDRFRSYQDGFEYSMSKLGLFTKRAINPLLRPFLWAIAFLFALLFGYLFFCTFIARERVFVAYRHEAWRWSDLRVSREVIDGYPATGPLPRVDWVYVVSYAPLVQRREDVRRSLSRLGIKDVSFHYDWDRQRVLQEKQLVSKTMFKDAINLHLGGTVQEYTLGKRADRAFENHDLRDLPVTEVTLGRIANFMQHRQIFESIVKNKQHAALVLEDDVLLAPWFRQRFCRMMDQLPRRFDVVYVGGCLDKGPNQPYAERYSETLYTAQAARCASAYIVSFQAAYKILNEGTVPFGLRNIDPYMENLMNTTIPEVFWVEPPLAFEGTKAVNPLYSSFRNQLFKSKQTVSIPREGDTSSSSAGKHGASGHAHDATYYD